MAAAGYDRQGVADHANNLASKIRSNLTNSMKAIGVDILTGVGTILVSSLVFMNLKLFLSLVALDEFVVTVMSHATSQFVVS